MLVRLLVVVLTLVGAVPVRICTCGAAHHHHHAPKPATDGERDSGPGPVVRPDPAPVHHDPDCHAVKPRPIMSLGVQLAVADVPPDSSPVVALAVPPEPAPAPGYRVCDSRPPPPDQPRYLSLRLLRN